VNSNDKLGVAALADGPINFYDSTSSDIEIANEAELAVFLMSREVL
jgi:hypothetical protein